MTTSPALFASAEPVRVSLRRGRVHPGAALLAVILGAAFTAACAVTSAANLRVDVFGFARFAALAVGMLATAGWCRWRGLEPRLGAAAAIVGCATLSLLACGAISNAGLRLAYPLADARLAAIDAAAGFDAGVIIRAVAERPLLVDVLSLAYNSSGALVVALVFVALARRRLALAWELAITAVAAMQTIAVLSPFIPAWGAIRHFALEHLLGNGLPGGAGTYQWPAFAHFYGGADPVLRIADMGGVVAFPSFHTVLALMITQALGDTRLRRAAMAWTAIIVLAAIPMGGHYVADLAAGFLVWLGAATLARRVSSPSA